MPVSLLSASASGPQTLKVVEIQRVAAPMVGASLSSFVLELLVYAANFAAWKAQSLLRLAGEHRPPKCWCILVFGGPMLLILLASLATEDGAVIIDLGGGVRSAEVAPPQLKPLPRTPLSLEFQQLDVRVVLNFLAKSGNQNIVVADGVSGTVTLLVVDRPWDECLSMVLLAAGLQAQRMGDDLMVVSALPR